MTPPPRYALVHIRFRDELQRFTLPADYRTFRDYISILARIATNTVTFNAEKDIVLSYLPHISYANTRGMYPAITWTDDNPATPVTVAHHPLANL